MVAMCWWDEVLMRFPASVEEWAHVALAWLAVSAIATPIIGICVRLAAPKRTVLIVLVGGMIPAVMIYGLLFVTFGREMLPRR